MRQVFVTTEEMFEEELRQRDPTRISLKQKDRFLAMKAQVNGKEN